MKKSLCSVLAWVLATGLLLGFVSAFAPLTAMAATDPYEMIAPDKPLSGSVVTDFALGHTFDNFAYRVVTVQGNAPAQVNALRAAATAYFTAGFQVNVPSNKVTTMAFSIRAVSGGDVNTAALYSLDLPHNLVGVDLPTISYADWQSYSGFLHNISDNIERNGGVGLKTNNSDLYNVAETNSFKGYWGSQHGRDFDALGVHNTSGVTPINPKEWEFEFYFFAQEPGKYEIDMALISAVGTDGPDNNGILAKETVTVYVDWKSATPTTNTATIAKTSETQAAVPFSLTSTNTGTWTVYADGSTTTPHATVTAAFAGGILTLTDSGGSITPGSYYVSVTEFSKTASDRLALTVGAFVPPTPPTIQSAATNTAGNQITITFNKAINSASLGAAPSGFTVTQGGPVTAVSASGSTITLTLTSAIAHGQTVTASYSPGTVAAADGGILAAFTNQSVTNNVPAPPTVPGAPQNLTLTPGDTQIVANWAAPASNGGSVITGYKIQLDDGAVTDKGATELTHTFTGLTNGITYTVKAWAVNAVGDSETPAQNTSTPQTAPIAPSITSATSTSVVNGTGGTFQVTATGTTPITYLLSGTVPTGVTINETSGLITIAATTAVGTYNFTITASNAASPPNAIQSFTLTVSNTYKITINPSNHPFTSAPPGYSNANMAQIFTITNTGTGVITNLSASFTDNRLNGAAYNNPIFEIVTVVNPTTIAPGSTTTVSVRPRNGLASGVYTGWLEIKGDNDAGEMVLLEFTVTTLTFIASVNPKNHTFPSRNAGYNNADLSQTFTITNIGSERLTGLTATLSGTHFQIITPLPTTALATNSSINLAIRPVSGLATRAAPYTGTLTINWANNSGEALAVNLSFSVGSNILYGDLNGDGIVDSADLVLMLRYFARPGVSIDLKAADVNGDGRVDMADLILLLRYFSQPGIILGPQN